MKETDTENRQDEDICLRSRRFWARQLGVCDASLLRAFKRGDLEAFRLGDRVLHSRAQILRYLAKREVKR